MPTRPKILIADDDEAFRSVLRRWLVQHGYNALECCDGGEVMGIVLTRRPALVLMEVSMPRCDGWRVLKELRRHALDVPVIMLTAASDEAARVRGLDSGADDYVVKPCSFPEVMARVRAVLRRCPPYDQVRRIRIGATVVDFLTRSARRGDHPVTLNRKEYELLEMLARAAGRPVARAALLGRVWGAAVDSTSHTLDTHIWRLRRKLGRAPDGGELIRNVPGTGYAIDCVVDDE